MGLESLFYAIAMMIIGMALSMIMTKNTLNKAAQLFKFIPIPCLISTTQLQLHQFFQLFPGLELAVSAIILTK